MKIGSKSTRKIPTPTYCSTIYQLAQNHSILNLLRVFYRAHLWENRIHLLDNKFVCYITIGGDDRCCQEKGDGGDGCVVGWNALCKKFEQYTKSTLDPINGLCTIVT